MRGPRWDSLGLRGNPFENVGPGERPDWVSVPAAVAEATARRPFTVELVGEKGAGKSTLLRALAARMQGDYRYVDQARPREAVAPIAGGLWCLDEANNAAPGWLGEVAQAARRVGASLLVGTHWSLAAQVPWIRSLALAAHPPGDWVQRRVASVALPAAAPFDFAAIAASLAESVRVTYAVQRVLYELAENLAWGGALPAALDDAIARARQDPTVAPWLPAASGSSPARG